MQPALGIRLMAPGAIGVEDMPAEGLRRVQPKLGVGLPGFDAAAGDGQQGDRAEQCGQGGAEREKSGWNVSWHGPDRVPSYAQMPVLIKSMREAASKKDGARVLVERRRPRGIEKEAMKLRAWLAVLAPSDELRHWFAERPRQWLGFRRRYLAELCMEEASAALSMLHDLADSVPVLTLLTRAGEQERGHGEILRDLLDGAKKPPSSTGPVRMAAGGPVRARRRP